MNTTDSTARTAKPSTPTRNILIGVVVVALLLLGVYLWGHFQTRSQLSAQQSEHEQRIAAVEGRLQQAQQDLSAANSRHQLLLARAGLYRTAIDLDQRNFGTASTHLQQAAAALGRVDASGGDINAQQLAALRGSIAEMNINVATDLQRQRAQVLRLAAQLDALAGETPGAAAAR
ncbi:hypothetical protein [Lysobacter sp. D1-1-M9]|uniref:hypothetical protein n=2 Tax=Novilysobacter TaxID=3382699 RepID=UPI002FC97552